MQTDSSFRRTTPTKSAHAAPEHVARETVDHPPAWTMANIVSDGATRWANRTAVIDAAGQLSFRELHACVRKLAERLLALQLQPGQRVAVAGGRNADTLVAILAVCMAGGVYVPLDCGQPEARLRSLQEDAEVRGLIAPTPLAERVATANGFAIELEGVSRVCRLPASRELRQLPRTESSSVAYIMYTSGSTGVPKGVQINHSSVRTFFEAHNERVRIGPGDRCLNSGPFHFDVSLLDVFLPLYAGASVVFGSELPIPTLMLRAIAQHRITHFYAVGTVLSMITGDGRQLDRYDLSSLRVLQTGSEVCNVRVVNQWLRRHPDLGFLNSYGPTEATVGCISFSKVKRGPIEEDQCPIGVPHRWTEIELVSESGTPLAGAGNVGEIVIAGPQLMRGYLRRPLEEQAAFLWLGNKRYYRTGDYASRDELGNYRFVGRRDDEVKLNGCRIHLNEVLRCLVDDFRVEGAVAGILDSRDGRPELGAAIVTTGLPSCELALAIRERVSTLLPSVMQPTRWAFLHAFPRLASGKVNRDACLARLLRARDESEARFFVQRGEALQALVNS